jgi:hypothetical protein
MGLLLCSSVPHKEVEVYPFIQDATALGE